MKTFLYLISIAVFLFLGYQAYQFNSEAAEAEKKLTELNTEKESLLKDNEKLRQDIDYFSLPHNLEKELRARFNVRFPYEKLIIIVPPSE